MSHISKSYSHCWKGFKYAQKCWKTKELVGAKGFFSKVNFINSIIIVSCGLYVNIFYVKYFIQVSTKYIITCILCDPSYFGKIINTLQILQGVCKLLK